MFTYRIASGTASLLCREWGEGEPLVLLHGNGEDSLYFEKQDSVEGRVGFRMKTVEDLDIVLL